jgi:hypothetical protein
MVFVIGLFPNIFLTRIKDATTRAASDFDARVMASPAPSYYQGPPKLLPRRAEATPLLEDNAPPASPKGGS